MIWTRQGFGAARADLPRWDSDSTEVCARIEKVRAPLKIVLKTKNDRWFIERWIEHHLKIVGPENLIIFDNMSDDPEVLSVYRKFCNEIEIVRFANPWFSVHHTFLFRKFYRSLATSSEYFIFIDTDEYLVLIDDDRYYHDNRIVSFVKDNDKYDLFPSTWLVNANWSATQFSCGVSACDLAINLACGKPLMRTDKIPQGYMNHNFQLSTQFFAPPFRSSLFLLHLSRLHPRQRITSNVNKLVTAGLVKQNETAESIAQRRDIKDKLSAQYIEEIRECLIFEQRTDGLSTVLSSGRMEMLENGNIKYFSESERAFIAEFIADPRAVYEFITDEYRLDTPVAQVLATSPISETRPFRS